MMIVNEALGENGQGGGGTLGNLMDSLGIPMDGSLGYYENTIGVLSLLQQLKDAGWDNPGGTKTNFSDWKKIIKVEAITEQITILNNAAGSNNVTPEFKETNSFLYKGKSEGFRILISMKNISSVLEYAFIIGHEINHSITDYFRNDFYKAINSTPNSATSRDAYGFFQEYNSYNWEKRLGNSNILNAFDTTYSRHGPGCHAGGINWGYSQTAIDVVKNNLNNLNKAWSIFYNNNLKK